MYVCMYAFDADGEGGGVGGEGGGGHNVTTSLRNSCFAV